MLETVKIIEIKEDILRQNNITANELREENKAKGTYFINLMSSPGSGKTTSLVRLINILKKDFSIGVMEADIDSDVDAHTIQNECGIEALQIHTGGMCHLDASMSKAGLTAFQDQSLDLVILENVGNLVCPAEFDTGSNLNVAILSVPEGDDKPSKYPLMFAVSDLVLINKIDVASYFDFSFESCEKKIKERNSSSEVFPYSAKTGEGIETIANKIAQLIMDYKKGE